MTAITTTRRLVKYHNKPQVVDGFHFDSKAEAAYYQMLKLDPIVAHIDVHPFYTLGHGDRVCIDFQVWYQNGAVEAIDVKGSTKTKAASDFRRIQKRWHHPFTKLRAVCLKRGRFEEWK